ncbi:MAG: hypothetical protein KC417_10680, partial [Myxococcales bacterium]|nr:hypothetical protein [Myxococcales bacterium]
MYDLGALWENVLHRPEKALANYRHATTLDPKNVSALYAARKLLLGSGDVLEALKLLDLEVTAEPNPQRKEQLLVELGHLRLEGTGDVASAIEAFERAHNLAPENPIATRMLAQALARQAELVDPSEAGQIRDVVASLFYELALTAPPEESLAYLEDALGAAPGHGPALELFEHHAIQLERNDLLPPRWVAYIEAKPEGAFTSIRRRRLGRAYIQNKQPMDAIACLEPIADRGDPEAADMLFDLYRTLGRDDDAARTMTIAVAGLPVEQRVPRLRDALHLRIDQGKYDEAVRCAREILVVAPADEVAFELLESEYTRRNELELLQGVYRNAARAPGVSDARRTQILASLARLSENKLGDVEAAVLAWEALRGIEPQNTDAARELERLFEAHKRWPELASALENATLGVTDLAERARLQRKLADLYAKRLDRPADAARALRSYRAMRPDDKAALDELAELLFRTRAFDEASALMRAQVAELPAGAKRTGLLRRLGALLETELDDPEGAYQMYTALLDEAPQDTSVLDALARLDAKLEQWERLLQTLAYYAELTQGAKQCALFMRMGEVAERELRDFDRSASFYGQALVIDGDSEAVLDALVRTYGRADRAEDLVRVLHEKAKREPNRTKRAAIRKRIARTLEAQFGASNATLEAWQRVLADDPESAEALRYAAENARRVGSPNELETILAKLADVVETELERVDLLVQRADLLAQKLDRRTEALAIMRSIVDDLNPGHLGALDWLRAHYESTNDMTQLAAVLDRQASVIAEPALRAPILRRLADLAAHQLSDPALSMHALERWSDDLPDDPEPLRRMAALLERDRQWIALRGIYDRLARIESDAARRNAVLRAAELSSTVLGDPDGAFARIRPLVENGDGEALSLLERIERKESIAPGAADARIKRADAERDANKRRNLWLDAARLLDGVPG